MIAVSYSGRRRFTVTALSPKPLVLFFFWCKIPLRVQVPNNHILAQNLYYNYYYPNPKYLIIGYMET